MLPLKKILLQNNSLLIYLIIIVLFDVLLQLIPLTNVLGYEFSAFNSIFLTFVSGIFFISLIKKLISKKINKSLVKKYSINAIAAFLIIPLLTSLSHSLFTISCPIIDGLIFYLVITVPSVLIGYSLASLISIVSRKFNIFLFTLIFLIILFIPLLEFYFYPQIYFYNPIFAYYPGTIYDEGIRVSFKLVEYRIFNIIYFGLIAFFSTRSIFTSKNNFKTTILFLSLITSLIFFFVSPLLGFSTTYSRLKSELNDTAVTDHFIIHYPSQLDKNLIQAIAVYHEFYYSELQKFFGFDFPSKINSYLFLNDQQKKNLFGTANADVAKPWMNSTFITYSDVQTTLKHEIAHCYSSGFGTGIFKVAAGLNPYLIEGIAVAADPIYDDNDINYIAEVAFNNGYKSDLKNLFNPLSFFTQTSSLSYIYAGSFTKYLINKFGIDKFKLLYKSGNFENAFSEPFGQVVQNYYSTLIDSNYVSKKDEANYYFGRKSIFYKACPRYVANRIQIAQNYFVENNYSNAIKIFKGVLNISNNISAVIGYSDCLIKLNQIDEAKNVINKYIHQFRNTAYEYSLELKLGDIYSLENNYWKADSLYKILSKQNPNYTYFYLSNLRQDLLISDSLLLPYLKGNNFDKFYILKELNSSKYNYFSIPVLINLADSFNSDYDLFMKNFQFKIEVTDFASAFAMYKLSDYMIMHLDFQRARKIAALATRFDQDKNFNVIANENYYMAEWMYKNHVQILNSLKIY